MFRKKILKLLIFVFVVKQCKHKRSFIGINHCLRAFEFLFQYFNFYFNFVKFALFNLIHSLLILSFHFLIYLNKINKNIKKIL